MIDLIDYGGGNLGSVGRCLDRLGVAYQTVDCGQNLSGTQPIIFPGVGSFGTVMTALTQRGFLEPLRDQLMDDTPYLGLCIGMQILFDSSEESPGVAGLQSIAGKVQRFQKGKVPQIGWNRITPSTPSDRLSGFVYFVNSYYAVPVDDSVISFRSDYYGTFCAAVQTASITAYQFHPEKSGLFGQQLVKDWCDAL